MNKGNGPSLPERKEKLLGVISDMITYDASHITYLLLQMCVDLLLLLSRVGREGRQAVRLGKTGGKWC